MSGRRFALALAALSAAFATTLVVLAAVTPWTVDEPNYLAAGMALVKRFRFDTFATILHGPLPLLANQIFFPAGLPAEQAVLAEHKLAARLGAVPFALLAAWGTAALAGRAFGRRAALLAMALFAANPIVLGHGCLITADMALTAAWIWLVLAAWGWLRQPSFGGLVAMGAGLGLALATKYLALFAIPALLLASGWAVLGRGFRPRLLWPRRPSLGAGRRLLDVAAALVLAGVVALAVLRTCYGWRTGGYHLRPPKPSAEALDPRDPNAGPLSSTFRALAEVPGAAAALALLPEPWARGVDYQKFYSERGGLTYFGDRVGPGFAAYFAVALATKLPLVLLLLLAAGIVVRAPPWPATLPALLLAFAGVPLLYLSFGTSLQIGVRYVLPVVPLLAVVASRAAERLCWARRGRVVLAALAVWLLLALAGWWPRYIGAFNPLAGRSPHLIFADSNVDWRHPAWSADTDGEALARRYPRAQRVYLASGPRFGMVWTHAFDLARVDPRDATRLHHWLRRFTPRDRIGAALLFEISAADFAAAVGAGGPDADPRGLTELAAALVGDGQPERALKLLRGVTDPNAPAVRAAAERLLAGAPPAAMMSAWLELGRYDKVLAAPAEQTTPLLRARALYERGDPAAAAAELRAAATARELSTDEVLLLAAALHEREPEAALAVLRKHAPPAGDPLRPAFDRRIAEFEAAVRAQRLVQRKAGGGR